MLINSILEFICSFFPPYPCVLQTEKYIRVADIVVQNLNQRCNRYKVEMSGPDAEYFVLSDNKLYIMGEVLDFNMPNRSYEVVISLINLETSQVVITRTHTVCVEPCECYES
jgi:hypothetical protein